MSKPIDSVTEFIEALRQAYYTPALVLIWAGILFILVLLLLYPTSVNAQSKHFHQDSIKANGDKKTEDDFNQSWCASVFPTYKVEHRDRVQGIRVDCLTPTYAIEMDYSYKYAESMGQALRYSAARYGESLVYEAQGGPIDRRTSRKPGVVIITNEAFDCRRLGYLYRTLDHHKIQMRVWTTGAYECQEHELRLDTLL